VSNAAKKEQSSMMRFDPDEERRSAFEAELHRLRQEHGDLDAAILALERMPLIDQIQIMRLKRRKLYLKDRIHFVEDQLTPDIIA
jgi:hypothetical protein